MSQPRNQMQAEAPEYGAPPLPSTPEPEPAKLGPLQRLIGVLLSPSETFEDINRKPTWLIPLLLVLVTSLAFAIYVNSQTDEGWRQMMRDRAASQPTPGGDANLEMALTIGKWATAAMVGLGSVIFFVIVAGVFALGLMLMQAQTTFKKILSVVAWSACATTLVGTVVAIASLLARDAESVSRIQPKDWGLISATNLGVALPSGTSPALVALASSFDIFTIWIVILLIIGFTAIAGSRKITRKKVATVVIGLWIVGVFIKVVGASFAPQ